jgi:hypothetical protein
MPGALDPKIEIKQRSTYQIVEIETANGDLFRITVQGDTIQVTSIEGGLSVQPKASNQVEIKAVN